MEMAGTEAVNMSKTYSLNMFKDFVPMCVFSETSQGENRNLRFVSVVIFHLLIAISKLSTIGASIHIIYIVSCR